MGVKGKGLYILIPLLIAAVGILLIVIFKIQMNRHDTKVLDDHNNHLEAEEIRADDKCLKITSDGIEGFVEDDKTNGTIKTDDDINRDSSAKNHNKWVGKYRGFYTYHYKDASATTDVKYYSNDGFEPENTPYVQLNTDGTYEFSLNLFSEMVLIDGIWEIDENNGNIAHLSKPSNVEGDSFERIILERAQDEAVILRGVSSIALGDYSSTTSYGDVFIKEGTHSQNDYYEKQYHFHDWARLYVNFLNTARVVRGEYGESLVLDDKLDRIDSIMLYDMDHDGIPELFISDGYELSFIHSVKDNEVIYLGEILFGEADIRKNLKTNEEKIFITSYFEGGGGAYYLSNVEMKSGSIAYEILFTEFYDSELITAEPEPVYGEILHEYYLNMKYIPTILEESGIDDISNYEVSKKTYEKAKADLESSHEIIKEIEFYEINANDLDSFHSGMETFIKALDDYILSNSSFMEQGKIEKEQRKGSAKSSKSESANLKPISWDFVDSSSTLTDKYGTYHNYHIYDGDKNTAWVEGVDGDGSGEWIALYKYDNVTLNKIEIHNGYKKSKDTYFKNNRLKTAQIEFSDGTYFRYEFKDSHSKIDVIELPNPVETYYIKLIIIDVYRGTTYRDTCITEIKGF